MQKKILSSEWMLVLSLLMVMSSLVVISEFNISRFRRLVDDEPTYNQEIIVTIKGAVKKPGLYKVNLGTTYEEVLKMSKPETFADMTHFPLKEGIKEPLELFVRELDFIVIQVTGAVKEPVVLSLPVRTRLCDIKSKISFLEEADKTLFRKKRILKNGEKIEVPRKIVD